jgi:transposase
MMFVEGSIIMRVGPTVSLTEEQRTELERLARGRTVEVRVSERARMVLLAAEGWQDKQIAETLGCERRTAGRWRRRFLETGVAGLKRDRPRGGRPSTARAAIESEVVRLTTQEPPADATHWSSASMARRVGTSASMVQRIWRAHGLKPHRVSTFKVSNDPQFKEKLEAIVGLYLSPPDHAIVLCCDEKTQIQALDRSQPGLPLKKGRAGTMTHDYIRHGTATLFAAMNVADGTVIAQQQRRHRHQEWLAFLKEIDAQTPRDRQVHLICDNYATHKHAKVRRWLARHPRFHVHFTPTSASWLNMVERFFRDLTQRELKRGVFRSLEQLEAALTDYIVRHNENPKPFIWTAKASDILEKIKRARTTLDKARTA